MMLKDTIKVLAESIFPKAVAMRRHLHANPELSFQEYETARFVQAKLDEIGISWTGMATTGIVGIIKGNKPSQAVIALRADMDALPITEIAGREYGSAKEGIMHACGHDVHTSSLLGTAQILNGLKNEFGGTIKLIFQPAEEKLPGGASLMIKEGALTNPIPSAIIGQHVDPALDAGTVGFRAGKYLASTDELYVTVKGKGGHAAQPEHNIDPVVIAAHIITALQQIVSRTANPRTPSVLSFGKVIANGVTNIIPDEVRLEGTLRTLDETWRKEALRQIKKMATGIAESMGASCQFDIAEGYPVVVNEEKLTAEVRCYAAEYMGSENIIDLDICMGAEDFAYYAQVTDGCFYRLGTRNEAMGITSALHTPAFDVDESSLGLSTGLMAYITLRRLGN